MDNADAFESTGDGILGSSLIAMNDGQLIDSTGLKVRVDWKLEKFDGEYEEGKTPVEVIEGGDGLPTVTTYPQLESDANLEEPAILPFPGNT